MENQKQENEDYAFGERAGIYEYDGNLTKEEAEKLARDYFENKTE